MKKLVKRSMAFSMAAVMAVGSVTTAFAGTWKKDSTGWWWQEENGSYPKATWKWIDGNQDGVSECYYFDQNGYMLVNTATPDGYKVNANGQWIENGTVKTQGTKKSGTASTAAKKPASVMGWVSGANGVEYKDITDQSKLHSYLKNVDKLENVSVATPVGTGITFLKDELQVGEDLYWKNRSGGTDYQLYYYGDMGDWEAAGYSSEYYVSGWRYPNFDSWTTPSGITIDYNCRVLDENGKIKTATAEELGLSYEGGKVRDVTYDANYPLKRVVDLYALNIETIDYDNWFEQSFGTGLRNHLSLLTGGQEQYIISKLSGQKSHYSDIDYTAEEKAKYDAEVNVLRDWLNSFDFEHASEMERAEKVHDMLKKASYDFEVYENKSLYSGDALYNMLIRKKGVCQDWAVTARFLCALVGLKCDIMGSTQADHMMYVMQVDGVPHGGDNTGLKLDLDWREESKLGTRETTNYWFGGSITY